MRRIRASVVGIVLSVVLLSACSDRAPSGAVHVVKLDGAIGPITERFVDRALDRAEDDSALLAVIELDTPGGLDLSMRAIVKRIERSSVPVAVYVYPPGGRAASAGTFITMAGHLAVMAPNTSIGAASAINADGSDIEGTLGKKVENDSVAFIRGIAELRGRNAEWAEQAVREAAAVNQSKAVELRVVDFVANDLDDLLHQAEGRTLQLRPNLNVTLEGVTQAPRVTTTMTVWEQFLGFLADPTIASLLISLGFLALLIEVASPGLIVPGTIGAIAIVLGFLGFGVLPVDMAGLVLIFLGLIMVALELFVPGGVLGVGGTVAITLGAIIAFRDTPADLRPPVWLLVVIVVVLTGAFGSMAYAVARTRGTGVPTGPVALVGQVAIARSPLSPDGWVFIQGERWQAQLEGGGHAEQGERLRVTGTDGLHLRVRKENDHV